MVLLSVIKGFIATFGGFWCKSIFDGTSYKFRRQSEKLSISFYSSDCVEKLTLLQDVQAVLLHSWQAPNPNALHPKA
jgi:hypothetical protein